jgi:hypothetical protein
MILRHAAPSNLRRLPASRPDPCRLPYTSSPLLSPWNQFAHRDGKAAIDGDTLILMLSGRLGMSLFLFAGITSGQSFEVASIRPSGAKSIRGERRRAG